MEVKGKIVEIGTTEQVNEKFSKRNLIVDVSENPAYPSPVKFEATQAGCDKLDELREGDEITVHFNLRGRAWKYKAGVNQYFNTLNVWKFDLHQTSAGSMKEANLANDSDDLGDSLPF